MNNEYFNYHDLFENFESDQSEHFESFESFEPIEPEANLSYLRQKVTQSAPVSYVSASGSYVKKEESPRKGTSLEELQEKLPPVRSIDEAEPQSKRAKQPEPRRKETFYNTKIESPLYEDRDSSDQRDPSKLRLLSHRSKELKEFMVILLIGILVILMMDLFTKINLMLRKV